MNTVWSDHVQGTDTLLYSRQLRFHDRFMPRYLPLFDLAEHRPLRILEIGCGPGALAQSLSRWYPKASITALDRDSRFIAYGQAHIPQVTFLEGDVAALPFPDGSFDVVISHTLAEHVDPEPFYREQYRILTKGGVCLVLTSRKTFQQSAPCLELTIHEQRFWEYAAKHTPSLEELGVGKYRQGESEMARTMATHGFSRISTGYAVIDLTPDSADVPEDLAKAMILADQAQELENLNSFRQQYPNLFFRDDFDFMETLIRERYQARLDQYSRSQKQWDTQVSTIMVLRGVKE